MTIAIACPKCSKKHQAPDGLAGKSARCGCGTVIRIPAAVAVAASGPSIFDELTAADVDKLKKAKEPAAKAGPGPGAVPNAAADYMARAAESRPSPSGMPSSVKMAMWGLAVPGCISLAIAIIVLSLWMGGRGGGRANALLPLILGMQLVIVAANLGAYFMLQNRTRGARIVGFVAAGLNLFGSPLNMICGVVAMIGLVNFDTGEYLAEKAEG